LRVGHPYHTSGCARELGRYTLAIGVIAATRAPPGGGAESHARRVAREPDDPIRTRRLTPALAAADRDPSAYAPRPARQPAQEARAARARCPSVGGRVSRFP